MHTISADLMQHPVQALRRYLGSARDEQIIQVVAMVDALPDRGAADNLIAPLRARLAQLRPARPLRFSRLLFMPLDPVIVPAPRWRAGYPSVPRTALAPIAQALHAELGAHGLEFDALIENSTTRDDGMILHAGFRLWPVAAEALANARPPPGWMEAGLPLALHGGITRGMAVVLGQATALHRLAASVSQGAVLRSQDVLLILNTANGHSPDAWGMLLALLLARLPQAETVLRVVIASGMIGPSSVLRAAADQAMDVILSGLETQGGAGGPMATIDLADAGAEATRITALLDGLHAASTGNDRRRWIETIRRQLDASCRARFETGLAGELIAPLLSLGPHAGPEEVTRLEDTARDLRQLEQAARRLGTQPAYETMLRRTATEVRAMRPDGALSLADRVRMVEILTNPDEALAMLEATAQG